ncbi:DUF2631 domain-containing protein [Corynebacterium guangdongense]|uniref:DUF2631 domain-containing protein n=1 Tax=Corynebacterium guangdongense TaxID=1783348 RepID=A0ABU1ZXE5_9CORY|nr:DUF2631 domain-containing protein [Corynebacterium guangdongense]MDR7329591.1 hypothetical protein [Corynebacterium guangdongense]WJZ18156.1 hypothetical protein CGUA_07970 [Corynebacterium guangdongense]
MATSHKKEHEVYNGVSTADVPNAAWGWSALPRTAVQIAGWVSVLIMLAFHFGNHQGHVETIWLLVLTGLLVIGLLLHAFEPKLSTVRTLTSHNKPVGHVEPDWAYDQKTLSGAYTNLTDGQLRALNIDPARVQHLRITEGGSAGRHSLQTGSTASQAL